METHGLDELKRLAMPATRFPNMVIEARRSSPTRVRRVANNLDWPNRQADAAVKLAILRRDFGDDVFEQFVTDCRRDQKGSQRLQQALHPLLPLFWNALCNHLRLGIGNCTPILFITLGQSGLFERLEARTVINAEETLCTTIAYDGRDLRFFQERIVEMLSDGEYELAFQVLFLVGTRIGMVPKRPEGRRVRRVFRHRALATRKRCAMTFMEHVAAEAFQKAFEQERFGIAVAIGERFTPDDLKEQIREAKGAAKARGQSIPDFTIATLTKALDELEKKLN